jgi:hypothetical protein
LKEILKVSIVLEEVAEILLKIIELGPKYLFLPKLDFFGPSTLRYEEGIGCLQKLVGLFSSWLFSLCLGRQLCSKSEIIENYI